MTPQNQFNNLTNEELYYIINNYVNDLSDGEKSKILNVLCERKIFEQLENAARPVQNPSNAEAPTSTEAEENVSSTKVQTGNGMAGGSKRTRSPQPSTSRTRSTSPDSQPKPEERSLSPERINRNDQNGPRNIRLHGESEKHYARFNMKGRRMTFTFNDAPTNETPLRWIENGITELLEHGLRGVSEDAYVGVVIENENFPGRPVAISFRKKSQMTADVILSVLAKILQSNDTFFSKDKMQMQLDIIESPVGKKRSFKNRQLGYDDFRNSCKKSLILINNKDNACLSYALAMAIQLRKDKNCSDFEQMRKGAPLLKERATQLCQDAGVDLTNGATLRHVEAFQNYLVDYTIMIYNSRNGRSRLFVGPVSPDRLKLNLYFEDGHYDVISSLKGVFAFSYFCEDCAEGYNTPNRHKKCPFICPCCHSAPKCPEIVDTSCNVCLRDFRGPACFDSHLKSGLCKKLNRCPKCLSSYWKSKKEHKCGFTFCNTCFKEQPYGHLCYMQELKVSKKKAESLKTEFLFVFYDFEATQDTVMNEKGDFLHKPNLCVAQHLCSACILNEDITERCGKCGVREFIFKDNPVMELLDYVYKMLEKFTVIAIAHNMKSYDGCFILDHIMSEKSRWVPNVIRAGCKLMSIKCGQKLTFLDSINYMPVALAKLPGTFKFPEAKGYFPHFFNTAENANYIGALPPKEDYGYAQMKTTDRQAFDVWYDGEITKNTQFDMQRDLVSYCKKDVDILRIACLKFRKLFIESNNIDPFQQATTIASACNAVFRQNFLKPKSIGIMPRGGYRLAENQSVIALKWLFWIQHSTGVNMEHAGNAREVRLKENILVDGFCRETNTVYQFHGCWFHGCAECFPNQTERVDDVDRVNDLVLRKERTAYQEKRIRQGYNLIVKWECEFRREMETNKDLADFLKTNKDLFKKEPLNPREAFFGGRTNAVKLYHKCTGNEKIHYFDFCSLYPSVNKYAKYPVGHPKVIVGIEECSMIPLNDIEGLVKCTVLPPQNLYHPVLPYRFNKRLTFPLCRTCLETANQENCTHDQEGRKIFGTWVSDEVKKAVSKGYEILEISEIWQYQTEIYDRNTKSGGLFADYVDQFLKVKQSSSGWPAWVKTDDDKRTYIAQYQEKEGIELKEKDISKNPGLRYISKLMLNSFWGKFGQRENMTQTSILQDAREMYRLLNDPNVEVDNILGINDETILVTWHNIEEASEPLRTVNVAIAAYTTAAARLMLYEYLDKLGRRVLYYDTDSIIFTSQPGEYMPPTGDFLGDFTDELEGYGPGSYIIEHVSGGPKNYSFIVYSPTLNTRSTVCKVKGITLNHANEQIINFDSMKGIVCENSPSVYVHNDRKIARTSNYKIFTTTEKKIYRLNYVKRRRIEESYDTLPFGFIE